VKREVDELFHCAFEQVFRLILSYEAHQQSTNKQQEDLTTLGLGRIALLVHATKERPRLSACLLFPVFQLIFQRSSRTSRHGERRDYFSAYYLSIFSQSQTPRSRRRGHL